MPQTQEADGSSIHPHTQAIALAEAQALSSANITRWFDLDSDNPMPQPTGTARVRRRPPAGNDHIKHRRTRSGCYTCRSRRVKGVQRARESAYIRSQCPATKSVSSSKLGQSRKTEQESESSSGEYEDEEVEQSPTGTLAIPEQESDLQDLFPASNARSARKKKSFQALPPVFTKPPYSVQEFSMSPSADDSSAVSKSRSTSTTLNSSGKLSSVSPIEPQELPYYSQLPRDIQYYLNYHQQHINYHHYFFKHVATNFVNKTLIEVALEYDPLLYAVVGFSAYHRTLRKPNGKVQDFLGYYNRSVQLLLKSLRGGQKHTDATLLTILQLAAFEEYLGDWVNLLSHQKAAYKMLLELYTPETIVQTETRRKILAWYTRFDLFAGLMSGYEAVLSREWMVAKEQYYAAMLQQDPHNLDYKMELSICKHRLIAIDMALLFAKLPRGEISMPEFLQKNELIGERIKLLRISLDPILKPEYRVMSSDGAPKLDPENIVGPYQPGLLYKGPLWTMNFLRLDWYAIDSLHKYQTALMLQQTPPSEIQQLALEQCRLLEAVANWPESPPGAALVAQSSLGIICLFLPRDEKHIMWCRRTLARSESMGYIYPPNFRTKIAEFWSISEPELEHWWLPDGEGLSAIVKSVRDFVRERESKTTNQTAEDVKNMKAMFSKLNVDDSPKDSPESIGNTYSEFATDGASAGSGHFDTSEHGGFSQPQHDNMGFSDMGFGLAMEDQHQQVMDGQEMGLWLDPMEQSLDPVWPTENMTFYDQPGQ